MPAPPLGDWVELWRERRERSWRPDRLAAMLRPDVLQRARAGYYGHMTHIDHQINRFVEIMHEHGLAENTYFCFTSDHGEMLGDHHLFRKIYPYEGSARVPMILAGPRASGIRRGEALAPVAELRDIMPTLLDCAGLEIPGTVEGRSLLPLARGEQAEWRPYLHGEHFFFGQSLHWLTDGMEKYVWCSGTGVEQLFDLRRDPQECTDLARQAAHAGRVGEWRARLIEELRGREEGYTDGQRLIPGRPVKPVLERPGYRE